jgi:hypothetical protein
VHKALLAKEYFLCFYMVFIWNTAINRTYGSTLWLVVKALTLGAFIRNNKINLIRDRFLQVFCIHSIAVGKHYVTTQ